MSKAYHSISTCTYIIWQYLAQRSEKSIIKVNHEAYTSFIIWQCWFGASQVNAWVARLRLEITTLLLGNHDRLMENLVDYASSIYFITSHLADKPNWLCCFHYFPQNKSSQHFVLWFFYSQNYRQNKMFTFVRTASWLSDYKLIPHITEDDESDLSFSFRFSSWLVKKMPQYYSRRMKTWPIDFN